MRDGHVRRDDREEQECRRFEEKLQKLYSQGVGQKSLDIRQEKD